MSFVKKDWFHAIVGCIGALLGTGVQVGCVNACIHQCDAQHPGEGWRTTIGGDVVVPTPRWQTCYDRCEVQARSAPANKAETDPSAVTSSKRMAYIEKNMTQAHAMQEAGDIDGAYEIYVELCNLYTYFPACGEVLARAQQWYAEQNARDADDVVVWLCDKKQYGPACYEREQRNASQRPAAEDSAPAEAQPPAEPPPSALPADAEPGCRAAIKSYCVAVCQAKPAAEHGPCEVQCMQRPISDYDGTLKECTPSLLGY